MSNSNTICTSTGTITGVFCATCADDGACNAKCHATRTIERGCAEKGGGDTRRVTWHQASSSPRSPRRGTIARFTRKLVERAKNAERGIRRWREENFSRAVSEVGGGANEASVGRGEGGLLCLEYHNGQSGRQKIQTQFRTQQLTDSFIRICIFIARHSPYSPRPQSM